MTARKSTTDGPLLSRTALMAIAAAATLGLAVAFLIWDSDADVNVFAGPPPTVTPTKLPDPGDTDGDGCTDQQENGSDEFAGGLRNFNDPWDYFNPSADGFVRLDDILGVIEHFAPGGGYPTGDEIYDRGPTLAGAGSSHWLRSPPDGVIDLPNDILGVILQYHHDCATPPVPGPTPSASAGLAFSIGVDADGDTTDDCDTSGGATKCSLPPDATFTLNFYLDSLPSGVSNYVALNSHITYSGITSKDNGDLEAWDDCQFSFAYYASGVAAWLCTTYLTTLETSTYTGLIGTNDFNCTANGAISLVHGELDTALFEDAATFHVEGNGTSETLAFNCDAPTPTNTPTDIPDTPQPTPTGPTPTITPTPAGPTQIPTCTPGSCDLNFALNVAGIPGCNTVAGDTKCSVPNGGVFTLEVLLTSLPDGTVDWEAYDIYITYTGVTSKDNVASEWEDCFAIFGVYAAGEVAAVCTIGLSAGPSSYTGVLMTNDFNCTSPGSITLVHGGPEGDTRLIERLGTILEETIDSETLTINCLTPTPTPTPTPFPDPVDITGFWNVSLSGVTGSCLIEFTQTGSALDADAFCNVSSPITLVGGLVPGSGTIDEFNGDFSLVFADAFCNPFTLDGTASADGSVITGAWFCTSQSFGSSFTGAPKIGSRGSIAVDADATTGTVDVKHNAVVGAPFTVSMNVTDLPSATQAGYSAYRVQLFWDESLLDYLPAGDPATEDVWPETCAPTRATQPDNDDATDDAYVSLACVGSGVSTHVGQVAQFQFVCQGEGNAHLSIGALFFNPTNGTLLIDSDGSQAGPFPTNASVNCIAPDKDLDGMPDFWEDLHACTDANVSDATDDDDADGKTHLEEFNADIDPCDDDTDNDGLLDGEELDTYNTDPLSADTDGDGLDDFEEVNTYSTDPTDADSDNDGLNDGFEVTLGTLPNTADSDSDTFPDGQEYTLGSDPLVMGSTPEHKSLPSTCEDAQDNDLDGKTDGDDSDCTGFPPPGVDVDTGFGTAPDGTPQGIRGQSTTISYKPPSATTNVTITITASNPPILGPDAMTDVNGDGLQWEYTFTIPTVWKFGDVPVVEIVDNGSPLDDFGFVLIDPSGDIFDVDTLDLIEGATVRLLIKNTATNEFDEMDPTTHAGMFSPEVNPQVTGEDGRYAWDVVAGDYKVVVSKPGCSTEESIVVTIPPPVTDLDVGLTCPDSDGDGLKDHLEIEIGSSFIDADHDGDTLSDGDEVLVHGTSPLLPDTDTDGCRDGAELGPDETLGGLRDPLNPWDFYDVRGPGAALPKDQIIDLPNDILTVILGFAPLGLPPYDVTLDRGVSSGPNVWNMTAPDGVIDLPNDILGVILQFNHNCQ